jgi:hypothetical protein
MNDFFEALTFLARKLEKWKAITFDIEKLYPRIEVEWVESGHSIQIPSPSYFNLFLVTFERL